MRRPADLLIPAILLALIGLPEAALSDKFLCEPTRPDGQGPFYRSGAPLRNQVGEGYRLYGTVKSARDCQILPHAKIELWMNGPEGKYGDAWWATLYSDGEGHYQFESHVPVNFGSRPPHIHMIVNAKGYRELITQHYPVKGTDKGLFDLVLIPAEAQ